MVAHNSNDWLPTGWTIQDRELKNGHRIRCYIHSKTGKKFYTKNDVIHYVKMESSQPTVAQTLYRKFKKESEEASTQHKTESNEHPEWLPKDWIVEIEAQASGSQTGKCYKCYIDPLSGNKFYSKPEVLRHLKTLEHTSYSSCTKKVDTGMHSTRNCQNKVVLESKMANYLKNKKSSSCSFSQNRIGTRRLSGNVLVEKYVPDGLPPGWILEIKVSGNTGKTRRDPFYTDPISGYVFRSRKDVLRYLESGEISRYALKPKGKETNDLEVPSVAKRQELTHDAIRDNPEPQQLSTPWAEGSKGNKRVAESSAISTSSANILPDEKRLNCTPCKSAGTQEDSGLSCSTTAKGNDSTRKQGNNGFAENGSGLLSPTDLPQDQELLENGTENHTHSKTRNSKRSLKIKKEYTFPRRSSKRLAGLDAASIPNMELSEQAPQHAAKYSSKGEVVSDLGLAFDSVDDGACKLPKAGFEHASPNIGCPMDEDPLITNEKPLEDQAATKDQMRNEEPERKDDDQEPQPSAPLQNAGCPVDEDPLTTSEKPFKDQAASKDQMWNLEPEREDDENPEAQPPFPSWDSWSDPCLEFAFKTLTGAIPIDDEIEIQAYFQQQSSTSNIEKEGSLDLPDVGFPNFLQSEISSHFNTPGRSPSRNQVPSPGHGNVSFAGCNSVGPQQPGVEGNTNNNRKFG